jgi:quinoprotein glucose dehydrogenase
MAPAQGGGTNWPGGSFDPETRILYVSSNSSLGLLSIVPPYPGQSDMDYIQGNAVAGPRTSGGAGSSAGGGRTEFEVPPRPPLTAEQRQRARLTIQGLPLQKPPYSVIAAIDMDRGEILWRIPHGETPDNIRNHPALQGLDIPRTGQPGSVGTLVTRTLLIAGDPGTHTLPSGERGAMLRAYDKATGDEVGTVVLPAQQSGSPMTYELDGVQYLVVAVSGAGYSGELIAFRLPA